MAPDFSQIVHQVSILALPAIFAITLHEAAHGFVAWRLGDDTAYRMGRVSFNPARHIDPIGTIALPLLLFFISGGRFLFGYAKPVPVNFGRLRHPRSDMVWVALAGPATNLLLAFVSSLLLHVVPDVPAAVQPWLFLNLRVSLQFNVFLAIFNMIPLPPLDGGRVAVGLLPRALALPLARLEQYGILILMLLLFVLPTLSPRLNVVGPLINGPAHWLIAAIGRLSGVS
jgi:Zn-dependent protease